MTEEERAVAYRASIQAQYEYRQAQAAALAGDPVALAALIADWQPLIDFLREEHANAQQESTTQPTEPTRAGYLGGWHRV